MGFVRNGNLFLRDESGKFILGGGTAGCDCCGTDGCYNLDSIALSQTGNTTYYGNCNLYEHPSVNTTYTAKTVSGAASEVIAETLVKVAGCDSALHDCKCEGSSLRRADFGTPGVSGNTATYTFDVCPEQGAGRMTHRIVIVFSRVEGPCYDT